MRSFTLTVALLLTGIVAARAQTLDASLQQELGQAVQRCLQQDGAPSASIAIVVADRLVYARAFGRASLLPPVRADVTTRYQLASVSKTFVAQAVLQLAAAGKLSLDDRLSRWYPDVTGAATITLRQLLSHTAGLPDHYPEGYPAGPKTRAATPDSIISEWGRHPLLAAPGTQFHYSNLDYEIAGRIVEKVSGQPLFSFLQEHVFKPAGMTSAIDLDTLPEGSHELATGYVRDALAPLHAAPFEGPGWSFGSGQVVTTATDVARWDIAFLQHRVLPAGLAQEEITRAPLAGGGTGPVALGLFVADEHGVTRIYHSGQGLGFTAIDMIYPQHHLALVILSNTSATGTVNKIMDQLIYLLLSPPADEVLARRVFAGLVAGVPDTSLFSADLKAYMTPELLALYRSSLADLGPVESFTARRPSTADGLETRDYDVEAGGHRLRLHLLVQGDGLLEDASIAEEASR